MPFSITFEPINNSDYFSRLSGMLKAESVIVEGWFGDLTNGQIHLLVEDPKLVLSRFKQEKITVLDCRPVLVFSIENAAEYIASIIAALIDAKIRVDYFFVKSTNQLVLGIDDIDKSIYVILDSLVNKKL